MTNQLSVKNINKKIGNKTIIKNFNYLFDVGAYAVTGPNGIGKSTLIRLLSGAENPDKGEIFINKINLLHSPYQAKKLLAYVPDQSFIYPFLTGKEFLNLIIKLRSYTTPVNLNELIILFNLSSVLDKFFSEMSLGTQKKFMLIAALCFKPHLLIMDEPTNGLDELSKANLIEIINQWKTSHIIIYATHDELLIEKTSSTLIQLDNAISTS
jgi:ABC-2 type transport system ATP-binding protein